MCFIVSILEKVCFPHTKVVQDRIWMGYIICTCYKSPSPYELLPSMLVSEIKINEVMVIKIHEVIKCLRTA